MIKKMTVWFALALAIALVGCGTSSDPAAETKKEPAAKSNAADKAKAELKEINDAIKGLKGADVPALVKAIKHRDRRVRRAACIEAGKRKVADPKVVKAMILVLVDHDRKAREAAMAALAKIGEPAVPHLIDGWKKGSPYGDKSFRMKGKKYTARLMIKKTLVKIGTPAVPALIKALDSKDTTVRLNTSGALGRMGPLAKPAIPRMLACVDDPVVQLRRNVIGDMSRIDPRDPAVKKAAEKALKDEDEGVRQSAERALKRIAAADGKPAPAAAEKPAAKGDSPRAAAEKKAPPAAKPIAKKAAPAKP